MDANKLQKLKDIKYSIRKTCGNCKFGCFKASCDWGTCSIYTYFHLKHEKEKSLSINISGFCRGHEYHKDCKRAYEHFKEFKEK